MLKQVVAVVMMAGMAMAAQQPKGKDAPKDIQSREPSGPVQSPAQVEAEQALTSRPAPTNAVTFPKVDPKNFTAASPTADEVNSFLQSLWGYDPNRVWSVAAILKTPAPGVAKIVVLVADRSQPGKSAQTVFFTTPDGKHAIADNVIDFGAKPFAETRRVLQERATGAARGAAGKEFELVEFADLQCPSCKDAQATMDHLAEDFPQARIVYENYPLTSIHPYAARAAAEGVCVRQAKGDAAFYTFARQVYDHQSGLTETGGPAVLSAAATAAGADPAAAATCAATQAAKDQVSADRKLGDDLGVMQTPTLYVNGHMLPITSLPYETLKRIVAFQAGQDGIAVRVQPTLNTLK